MLSELSVRDLGVIEELSLVLGPGMTALTGETGAGKTLVVGAIELLLGGRAENSLVRPGAVEAVVEGRFDLDGEEVILRRVVPAEGRSRAYVNGAMATAATLADLGTRLVDLHGQQTHRSLLSTSAQREALDEFAQIDLGPLLAARQEVAALRHELTGQGGDAGARAREMDLLRFQLDELGRAGISDPDEDVHLDAEEDRLADAVAHREAGARAHAELQGDGAALDALGSAISSLSGRGPYHAVEGRLRASLEDLTDLAADLRDASEAIVEDPARLDEVRTRRQLLVELRRKYGSATSGGDPTLAGVLAYAEQAAQRLAELERHEARAAVLDDELAAAEQREAAAAAVVGAARRAAAPRLGESVQRELRKLAMPKATLEVAVGATEPGAEVRFLLAANPGAPALPLAKVASGGELARTMLALRLVLSAAPPTLVFDEVDAGIGGEAAVAVGAALARLGETHQVLVVTHLPQVASAAHAHVGVAKQQRRTRTLTSVRHLDHEARVVELSRMLSGSPDSDAAHRHARELLDDAPGRGAR